MRWYEKNPSILCLLQEFIINSTTACIRLNDFLIWQKKPIFFSSAVVLKWKEYLECYRVANGHREEGNIENDKTTDYRHVSEGERMAVSDISSSHWLCVHGRGRHTDRNSVKH